MEKSEVFEEIEDIEEEAKEVSKIIKKDIKELLETEVSISRVTYNETNNMLRINLAPKELANQLDEKYDEVSVSSSGNWQLRFSID